MVSRPYFFHSPWPMSGCVRKGATPTPTPTTPNHEPLAWFAPAAHPRPRALWVGGTCHVDITRHGKQRSVGAWVRGHLGPIPSPFQFHHAGLFSPCVPHTL